MHQNDQENPLHDIHPEVAYSDLEDIDLSAFFGAPELDIEDHIRSIARLASIGQLKQVIGLSLDSEDRERELLIEQFVEKKMAVVRSIRQAMSEIG